MLPFFPRLSSGAYIICYLVHQISLFPEQWIPFQRVRLSAPSKIDELGQDKVIVQPECWIVLSPAPDHVQFGEDARHRTQVA
jgi:hypothetical protein